MACASDAELTGTLAAQRDRWEAAGIDDYEFTLHWEEFSYLGGGYRVSVIDGQPGSVVRFTEPIAGPDAATIDLSPLPATIDEVFEVIEADLDADRVVACYDAELGYSVDVLIDRILNNEDDETTIAITELTAAGSPLPSTGCPSSAAVTTISTTSVSQTPAEHAPASSAGSTVSLGFDDSVPGGRAVAFPAAQFVVVPDDPGTTVEVSLLEYESTLTLQDSDGSTLRVRAVRGRPELARDRSPGIENVEPFEHGGRGYSPASAAR
jgi:hypothetical protein